MTTVRTPPSEIPPRARWGLEQLPPEPIDWKPQPPMLTRILRATSAPMLVSVAVFVLIIIVTAISIFVLPRVPSNAATPPEAPAENASEHGLAGPPAAAETDEPTGQAASRQEPAQELVVHVVGEVAKPGLVRLAPGARVAEAIHGAGGETQNAVLAAVNLARPVSDGEQIVVPDAESAASIEAASQGVHGSPGDGRINLNTADRADLESLPRVGPALAQRIIDWREANGGFGSAEQLLEVSGIGQRTFEGLSSLVVV